MRGKAEKAAKLLQFIGITPAHAGKSKKDFRAEHPE